MQKVSQAWKDNQNNTLVSESDIEISLKMTDPDAYEDASATDNGDVYFSNTSNIVSDGDKNITPYATLETNQWLLDGSREIVPDSNYGEAGYVGETMCDANKTYSANPIVTVNFGSVHPNLLQGITIRWSEFLGEYATDFIVTVYNGDTIVAQQTVANNTTVTSVVTMDISNYNRIAVEVVKWSIAYRRARIEEIFVGIYKVFSKTNIFSYDCTQTVDPISAELPKAEVSFSIDNVDETYNPYNNEGLSKYLMERQEINVKYGYKLDSGVEWISGGKYYISEWDAKQNGMSADFKARDLLEFMTGTYYKGVYSPLGETNLYDLAEDVLRDADLPLNSDGSVKWVIDERLKDCYTKAPLPIDTHANCLQMIANAGECVFYQDRQGVLRLERLIAQSNLFDANNLTNLYPDGSGYIWENADIYSCIIPVQYGVTYDITSLYNSNINVYAYTKTYPTTKTTIYDESGVAGEGTLWEEGATTQVTPPSEDCKYLVIAFYWDNKGFARTLDEIAGSLYVGRSTFDYEITHFNSYSKSDLSLSKPLKQVDVPCYSYSMASEKSELYKGVMNIEGTEDVLITYSGAALNVTPWVDGGTLNSVEHYTHCCVLNITATGDVTITIEGYSLEASSATISTLSGASGETVSVDNPLITSQSRAKAVGKWIETYMRNRATLSSSWRADPRLDALDMVDNENDYGSNKVIMTNVKYTYNGAFRGSGEGRVI